MNTKSALQYQYETTMAELIVISDLIPNKINSLCLVKETLS